MSACVPNIKSRDGEYSVSTILNQWLPSSVAHISRRTSSVISRSSGLIRSICPVLALMAKWSSLPAIEYEMSPRTTPDADT